MGFILSFFLKHLDKIVAVLLVAALVGFIYVTGRKDERNLLQPKINLLQTTIATERKSHEEAMEANRIAAEQRFVAAVDLREQNRVRLEDRLHFHSTRADSLAKRLRDAEAGRVRQRSSSENAPVVCRDFDANPDQLSLSDREILVWLASRADGVVEQLKSCVEQYNGVVRIYGSPN